MNPPNWLIPLFERFALMSANMPRLEFPGALKLLNKTVVLWPSAPDEATQEMAAEVFEALGDCFKAVVSYSEDVPFENAKLIRLSEDAKGLIGYPKRPAAEKLNYFSASIDLSPRFELPLSIMPVWAGIPLRLGRDSSHAGDAYNLILPGKMGAEIRALLAANERV